MGRVPNRLVRGTAARQQILKVLGDDAADDMFVKMGCFDACQVLAPALTSDGNRDEQREMTQRQLLENL